MVHSFLRLFASIFAFALLTLLTQVGGVIYLLCKISFQFTKKRLRFAHKLLIFISIYFLLTFTLIPFLASKFGRVPLPYFASAEVPLKPINVVLCLLNRTYVKPELKKVLIATAQKMNQKYSNTVICYLDTSFPFLDKFPLLPHLSHHDGKKADLAFCYVDTKTGEQILDSAPSWIGYGIFETPKQGESNQTLACKKNGYWQYDFAKYLGFPFIASMKMDETRTKSLVNFLANSPQIRMILIEPHLKNRLGLLSGKIRFQGCHSVRHDDHIHVQL